MVSVRRSSGVLLYLGLKVTGIPLGIVPSVLASRWLSPDEFGEYALLIAIATATNAFSLAGMDQLYLQHRITLAQFRRFVAYWLSLYVLATILITLPFPGFNGSGVLAMAAIAVGVALTTSSSVNLMVLQADLRLTRRATTEAMSKVAAILPLAFVATLLQASLVWSGLAFLLGGLCALIVTELQVRRPSRERGLTVRDWSAAVKEGLPYGLSSALFAFSKQAPLVLLGLIVSRSEVGMLRVGLSVYVAIQVLAVALNHEILRPHLFRSSEEPRYLLRVSLVTNLALGTATALALFTAGPFLVGVLFGNAYADAVPVVRTLALAAPFFFMSTWGDTVLIWAGRSYAVVLRLIVTLSATCALLLMLGQSGAGGRLSRS